MKYIGVLSLIFFLLGLQQIMASGSDDSKSFITIYKKLADIRIDLHKVRAHHALMMLDLKHENANVIASFTSSPSTSDKHKAQIVTELKNRLKKFHIEDRGHKVVRDKLFRLISSAIDKIEVSITTTEPPYLMSNYTQSFEMLHDWIEEFYEEYNITFRFPSKFTVNNDDTIQFTY